MISFLIKKQNFNRIVITFRFKSKRKQEQVKHNKHVLSSLAPTNVFSASGTYFPKHKDTPTFYHFFFNFTNNFQIQLFPDENCSNLYAYFMSTHLSSDLPCLRECVNICESVYLCICMCGHFCMASDFYKYSLSI